ncbi:hypothetical protein KUTeg_000964 [Tegillarca granosa]|uniref:Uncharacterized protein n=1 Tax=Tegillarca granosa TaxID=220873 RepID=A0ABQ9FW46_TEGGR|nr:hypothetical protein KUTeg_000964 [Tegillarca granosa]
MADEIRLNSILIFIIGIILLSDAAVWKDVGEKVKSNINLNSVKTFEDKRSSKLSVRDIVEAADGEDLTETDTAETVEGEHIVRYKETFQGLEVFDAYVTVDIDKKTGQFTGRASGNMLGGISDDVTSVEPNLSQSDALSIAKSQYDLDPNSVKYSSEKYLSGEALEFFLRGTVDYSAGGDVTKYNMGTRELCDQSVDGRSITHVNDYEDGLDVHFASGVFNKAICFISKSEGFSIKTTFQIFTHANRFYWHSLSDFDDAACGVIKAAYDLGYEPTAIYESFTKVGIDGCVLDNHVRMVGARMSLNGLSGVRGQKLMFKIDLSEVPLSKSIQVLTIGGSGDVDLYVHRRTSFKMTNAVLSSSNKGNLELLTIPKKLFRKGYCFIVLTAKETSFKDVTLTTDISG